MIKIESKSLCCGCSACSSCCPKHCITMVEDTEGFLYPSVDETLCVDCGLCEKVCHEINPYEGRMPLEIKAGQSEDETVRRESSSGGLFSLLAQKCIEKNGVVFGVRFDENWQCEFDYSETLQGIKQFRGSKYVQAQVGTAYKDALRFLQEGRMVLFTGTPCQIAGLRHSLRRDYDNLIAVDVVCHGVPSPKVWRLYLNNEKEKARQGKIQFCSPLSLISSVRNPFKELKDVQIEGVSFRDKRLSWKKYSFALTFSKATDDGRKNTVSLSQIHYKNAYLRAFMANLDLRPSCYNCQAKAGRSHSDITLADCWGAELNHKSLFDDLGTSMILINSKKGKEVMDGLNIRTENSTYEFLMEHNRAYAESYKPHPMRGVFFKRIGTESDIIHVTESMLNPPLWISLLKFPKKIYSYIWIRLLKK